MKWLRLGGGRSYLGRSITSLGPSGPAREILGNLPATQLSSKGSPMHNPATLIRRLIDLGHLLGYAWFIAFGAKQKGFHARHRLDSVELFGCSLKLVSSIQPTKRPFYKAIHGPLTPRSTGAVPTGAGAQKPKPNRRGNGPVGGKKRRTPSHMLVQGGHGKPGPQSAQYALGSCGSGARELVVPQRSKQLLFGCGPGTLRIFWRGHATCRFRFQDSS